MYRLHLKDQKQLGRQQELTARFERRNRRQLDKRTVCEGKGQQKDRDKIKANFKPEMDNVILHFSTMQITEKDEILEAPPDEHQSVRNANQQERNEDANKDMG